MVQTFFVGQSAHENIQQVDITSSPTLQHLKSKIAKLFSFVDAESIRFFDDGGKELGTLEDINNSPSPIELRNTPDASISLPSGPDPLPFVGNHYEIYPDALGNYDRLFARYGPMIKTVNMGTTIFHTNDPIISRYILREGDFFTKTTSDPSHPLYYMNVQEALFTCNSDSPAFPASHKFVPPALSPRAIAHHTPLIQEAARSIFPVLDQLAERDLAFNVYHYMFKLAGQIIWRVIVGQDVQHFEAIDTPPTLAIRLFGQFLHLMKKMSLRPSWYGKLPFGEPAKLRAVRKQLFETVELAMDNSVIPGGDTLELHDKMSPVHASCIADYLCRVRDRDGNGLPRDVLLGNVVVLLGAGFTTSASLLSWTLYSLVKYPGNEERLLQEMINHGADGKRSWSYEDVHALKFLDCFIKEAQRMHSPSFQTARNAKTDVILPGGYIIPKNSVVISCFPSMHKNPQYWDNPQLFNPDRWMPEGFAAKAASSGVYTPFAAGGRGCVGFNLALLEVKMVLLELVYHYHFEDSSPDAVVYDPEFLVTRPLNFYMRPVRRTSWPESKS
ncbi:putative cytochrome P450 monooxygenase [Corynespora cassiicola Philippines]|uniref:Putative cytochrome P450 monooxygenase n=1 Tax=Corynespora cassiicola Philippines TaxID=1448308 RepID=A0A2T2N1Q6_CORCC|nr:putative cytochrome P450 monooxygenase [Corynespora cassiicola Philippines]